MCVKLVIYEDYTEMHGQQKIKSLRNVSNCTALFHFCTFEFVCPLYKGS